MHHTALVNASISNESKTGYIYQEICRKSLDEQDGYLLTLNLVIKSPHIKNTKTSNIIINVLISSFVKYMKLEKLTYTQDK